jgi:hypothetical protein
LVIPSVISSFPFPELSFLSAKYNAEGPSGPPLINIPLNVTQPEMNPTTEIKPTAEMKPTTEINSMTEIKPTTNMKISKDITPKPFQSNSARYPIFAPKFIKPTKVKTDYSLTYRNVPAGWVAMLSQRLNEDQPSWHADTELQTAPPDIKTSSSSCSFLAGSFTTLEGTCSKYGACMVDKLQYGKHVRILY